MPPNRDPRYKPGETTERMLKTADEAIGESLRQAEETGELRHLYGKPLDLSDDSPEWLVNRFLKNAGFAHPMLEQAKELDETRRQIEAGLEKVRKRRAWLSRPEHPYSAQQAESFNQQRASALDDYQEKLTQLNHAILTYNLGAPDSLHRSQIRVEEVVEQAAREIPPLDLLPPAPGPAASRPPLWRRFRRALSAGE